MKGKGFYFHELPGFRVTDAVLGALGTVSSVYSLPHQDLLGMDYKGSEVLIPLTDAVVTGINRKTAEVYTKLPEGLLEVYLTDSGEQERDDADETEPDED